MSDKYDKIISKNNDYKSLIKREPTPLTPNFAEEYIAQYLETVKENPKRVKDVPEIYKTDPKFRDQYLEIVVVALSRDGLMIQHLPEFQGSLELAKIATEQNPKAISFFDESIRHNDELMLPLVEKDGSLLKDASPTLQDNEELVKKALENRGSLMDVSPRLRDKEDVVLIAIEHNVDALKYASSRLKKDKDFVEEAISIRPESFKHIDSSLRNDKDYCLDLLNKGFLDTFNDFEYSIRTNPEIIQTAYEKMDELGIGLSRRVEYYIENPYNFSNEARPRIKFNQEHIANAREKQNDIEL